MSVIFLFRFGVGLITAVVLSSKRLSSLWHRKMWISKSTWTRKRIYWLNILFIYPMRSANLLRYPHGYLCPGFRCFYVLTLKGTFFYQITTGSMLSSSVLDTISMNQYTLFVFFCSLISRRVKMDVEYGVHSKNKQKQSIVLIVNSTFTLTNSLFFFF